MHENGIYLFLLFLMQIDQNVLPTKKTEIAIEMELATKVWTHYGYLIAKNKVYLFLIYFLLNYQISDVSFFFYQQWTTLLKNRKHEKLVEELYTT